jgi:hypothetical protein
VPGRRPCMGLPGGAAGKASSFLRVVIPAKVDPSSLFLARIVDRSFGDFHDLASRVGSSRNSSVSSEARRSRSNGVVTYGVDSQESENESHGDLKAGNTIGDKNFQISA